MAQGNQQQSGEERVGSPLQVGLFWAFVGIPLAWGVVETLIKAAKLF